MLHGSASSSAFFFFSQNKNLLLTFMALHLSCFNIHLANCCFNITTVRTWLSENWFYPICLNEGWGKWLRECVERKWWASKMMVWARKCIQMPGIVIYVKKKTGENFHSQACLSLEMALSRIIYTEGNKYIFLFLSGRCHPNVALQGINIYHCNDCFNTVLVRIKYTAVAAAVGRGT